MIIHNGITDIKEEIRKLFSPEDMIDLSNECVNFYMDSFNNQGFTDYGFQLWDKSLKDNGATLVLSGQLRNSIKVQSITNNGFTIISDMDYSQIHNEGGMIPITEPMRKYFWAMFSKTGNENWKWLALKKDPIIIPKRQFMGESHTLTANLIDIAVKNYIK